MKSRLELNRVGDDSSKYGGGREGKETGIHKKVIIMGYFFGSVFKTLPSSVRGAGLILCCGAKIPHASQLKKAKHKTEAIL